MVEMTIEAMQAVFNNLPLPLRMKISVRAGFGLSSADVLDALSPAEIKTIESAIEEYNSKADSVMVE